MAGRPSTVGPEPRRPRRGYLDWMRGLAVLIMIEAHLMDSWTRFPDRESREFVWAMIVGGMGAPLFLFLAGVAVPLSAGSKFRRSAQAGPEWSGAAATRGAARAVARRGLEIFGLAFLFRLQAWVLGWGSPSTLLKVDILNIMGPSIVAAALLWGAFRTTRARCAVFAIATVAVALVTPIVRATGWVGALPDPIEAYIRPVQGFSGFVFFPWIGFVLAGGILGLAIDGLRTRAEESRLNAWHAAAGAGLALAAYGASFLPSPYEQSSFWTSSPSYFFLRVGLMTAVVGLAYAWESRPGGVGKRSPLQQLGRTSLFIYWIHVELVYGLISLPLHRALPLGIAWTALAVFTVLMLACSIGKDRLAARWKLRRQTPADVATSTVP